METIGDRIKAKRKELGLTQLELAKKLNVTDRAVSKWEQNDGNPDLTILPVLSGILGVSLDYLITGKYPDVVPMSRIEYAAKNSDCSMLMEIGAKALKQKDDTGRDIIDYIAIYDSKAVFKQLLEIVPLSKWLSAYQYSDSVRRDPVDVVKLLVSFDMLEEMEEMRLFDVTCRNMATSQKACTIQNKMILEHIICFGSHRIIAKALQNTECCQDALSMALDKNLKDAVDKVLPFALQMKLFISADDAVKLILLGFGDRTEQLIAPYVEAKRYTMSDIHKIDNARIAVNSSLTEKEKAVQRCLYNGILRIDEAAKLQPTELAIQTVQTYPIHCVELVERWMDEGNYQKMFSFGVDHDLQGFAQFLLRPDYKNREQRLRNELWENLASPATLQLQEFNNSWFYKASNSDSYACLSPAMKQEYLKKLIAKAREEAVTFISFEAEKNKQIGDYTEDYFAQEIGKGNYDGAVVKLCVVLETKLKYEYRYTGSFEEMLTQYCELFETVDDEASNYDPYTPALLQNLRMARNSIVHPVEKQVKLSLDEIKTCVNYILKQMK